MAVTLLVYTARIDCGDPDALDVTALRGGDGGAPFAPSWQILTPAKAAMRRADLAAAAGRVDEAHLIDAATFEIYEPLYLDEMRASYVANRAAWRDLLARERVALTCFCAPRHGQALRCHRRSLAAILTKCGAVDMGELPRVSRRKGARTG